MPATCELSATLQQLQLRRLVHRIFAVAGPDIISIHEWKNVTKDWSAREATALEDSTPHTVYRLSVETEIEGERIDQRACQFCSLPGAALTV